MTTSTAALVAALTPLDEHVLAAVARVQAPPTTARVVRELYRVSTRSAGATDDQAREVLEILHGLARAECVHELDGVWHPGPAPMRAPTNPRGGRTDDRAPAADPGRRRTAPRRSRSR